MRYVNRVVAAAMTTLLFLSTIPLTVADVLAAPKDTKPMAVQEGPVRGVLLSADGKGLAKAVVDVRDSKGEVLSMGVTKADGSFCLASVPAGEYVLTVNGEFTSALRVAKDAEAKGISLTLPSRSPYSAGAEGDPGDNKALYVIGGVAVTALALTLMFEASDDCR